MPAHVIIGAQWGDEGKGRVADYFAMQSDIVARYAGGDNAGHTVAYGGQTFKLHLVPSGVLHANTICVLGGGMVINPLRLAEELRGLADQGVDIDPGRIRIAETAHLITPMHIAMDGAGEASRGSEAIGTTKRGIGPAYTSKAARTGLRAGLLHHPDRLERALRDHFERENRVLEALYSLPPVDFEAARGPLLEAAAFLRPYLEDVPLYLHGALAAGKQVLCEGAQGTLLDLDHGTYPFVTSSSATAGGAITGLGISPRWIDRITGVAKAFSTRVGAGPFPTELLDETGDRLRGTGENPWDEFGTTTGRPRRCGWLDLVILRYAARINGLSDLVITKLDVLSGFEDLKVADAYTIEGEEVREYPSEYERFAAAQPIYAQLPGWQEEITQVKTFDALPANAQRYIHHIEQAIGVRARQVTVGPAREQAVNRN